MKRLALISCLVAIGLGAFLLGARFGPRHAPATRAEARQILYYVDPMNPAHTSPKPGLAPCGMKMEPVYADQLLGGPGPTGQAGTVPGTVRISLRKSSN